jgi:hypothetical protein
MPARFVNIDHAMDVLIASDDAKTTWISNSHPAYNQGLNRILIRLENGPSFARLSVLLSPVGAIDGKR